MPLYTVEVVVQETRTLYFDLPEVENPGPSTYAAKAEALARAIDLRVTDADDSYGHGDFKIVKYGPAGSVES